MDFRKNLYLLIFPILWISCEPHDHPTFWFDIAYRNLSSQDVLFTFHSEVDPNIRKQELIHSGGIGLECMFNTDRSDFEGVFGDCLGASRLTIQFSDSTGYYYEYLKMSSYPLNGKPDYDFSPFKQDEDGIYYFDITQEDLEGAYRLPDSVLFDYPN
jgi:hypothetical protein